MKNVKILILLLTLMIILSSCSSLSEAGKILRNEKTATTDEFLIQKKEPLTQPPDFKRMPEPGSIENRSVTNQNKFEKILKTNQTKSSENQTKSSTTEQSILNRIKK